MGRGDLTDSQWKLLEPLLPVSNGRHGRWRDHRQVINGILYRLRTGVPWRDLPERFGPWKTAYERHRLWSADGTWERLLRDIQAVADRDGQIDWDISVDSSAVRAHQHAAGAPTAPPPEVAPLKGDAPRTNQGKPTRLDPLSQAVVERAARRLAALEEAAAQRSTSRQTGDAASCPSSSPQASEETAPNSSP
jgi:transposase